MCMQGTCAPCMRMLTSCACAHTHSLVGPFVHIACCIAITLLRTMPCFGSIRRSKPLRLQMLAVGCAVGVSSTFGAPIGGVLFSIEATAQYFLVSIYWRCAPPHRLAQCMQSPVCLQSPVCMHSPCAYIFSACIFSARMDPSIACGTGASSRASPAPSSLACSPHGGDGPNAAKTWT